MKKTAKIVISLLLLLSVVCSFAACSLRDCINDFIHRKDKGGYVEWNESFPFPKGYTGGIVPNYQYHLDYEIKWLETYEELSDAVTRLKSHGSEVPPIIFFDCEEYGFDIKFCLSFSRGKINEGQGYFDRNVGKVTVGAYVFFEEVAIDELIFSTTDVYKSIKIENTKYPRDAILSNPTDSTEVKIVAEKWLPDAISFRYFVEFDNVSQFSFITSLHFKLTEDQIEILEKTVAIIK